MSGTTAMDTRILTIPKVNPDWVIVTAVDVNRDLRADLIFQNRVSGQIAYWLMWDNTVLDTRLIAGVNPSWRLAGVGDLNRDDQPDFVFPAYRRRGVVHGGRDCPRHAHDRDAWRPALEGARRARRQQQRARGPDSSTTPTAGSRPG